MNAVSLAKRRAAARRDQDGAAMFVVAMTIAVLASVGVYALAAAATEVKMSGNERQNTQTHYLAEYGILGAAREIVSSRADLYLGLMEGASTSDTCLSTPGMPSTAAAITKACRRLDSKELGGGWANPAIDAYQAKVPYKAGVDPGSFGATPMNGDFFVELTEATQAKPTARYDLNLNLCFVQMVATGYGITQPLHPALSTTADLSMYSGEGIEMQRARIVVGPVRCPK